MKYSFFSSALTWLPSALIMAVSASGASSAPFASFVKYVPVGIGTRQKKKKKKGERLGFWSVFL